MTPAFAGRLAQLVLMLGSDQDGEALNAARAIRRTLHSQGKDLHYLANQIRNARPMLGEPDLDDDRALLNAALAADRLSDWELEFLHSLRRWIRRGRALTMKQRDTLATIVDKRRAA